MGDIVEVRARRPCGELDTKLKDVRIPRANLGPCPVCGHDIVENRKGYSCWSREDPGCGFVIWKSKAGKTSADRDRARADQDRPHREAGDRLQGPLGKSFRARLALSQTEDGKWRVEFDEPWAKEGAKPPEAESAGEGPADGQQRRLPTPKSADDRQPGVAAWVRAPL